MKFHAADIHPMRFLRRFPEAVAIITAASRHCPRGILPGSAFQHLVGEVMERYDRALQKLPFEKRPSNTDVAKSIIDDIGHLAIFTSAGRHTFLLSWGITQLLTHTELGDIRLADLKLPYHAFYLSFEGALDVGLPGPPNVIDGAYVELIPAMGPAEAPTLSFYVTSRRLDGPHRGSAAWIAGQEPHFFAPLGLSATREDTLEAALLRATAAGEIILQADPTIAAELSNAAAQARKEGIPLTHPSLNGFERAALFNAASLPTVRVVLSLLCNALCLLSAEPPAGEAQWPEEAPATLVQAVAAAETLKRRRTVGGRLLGEGYLPVRFIDFSLGASAPTETGNPSGRKVAPHWRRGHWRRQPYGVDRSETRLLWIRPVLVRRDRGEPEQGSIYLLRE